MLHTDTEQLNAIFQDFYLSTGISLFLFNKKQCCQFTLPDLQSAFCATVRTHSQLAQQCENCAENAFAVCRRTKKTYVHMCHMGMIEAASPLYSDGLLLGYIWLGPVLEKQTTQETQKMHIYNMCRQYKLSAQKLLDAYDKLKMLDSNRINAVVRMMELCGQYLCTQHIISDNAIIMPQRINSYIQGHLAEALSAKTICQELHLSRSALYRLVQTHFQMGIGTYIRLQRLERAKQLLRKGNYSVSEIAEAIGFGDTNYFTKFFRQHEGMTPSEFRRR